MEDSITDIIPERMIVSNDSSIAASMVEAEMNENGARTADLSDFLVVDEVKIRPSKLLFMNTFEGKRFEKIIEIVNCGFKSAIVRIETPSYSAFHIKAFREGLRVCPGMKIVRKLTYTYRQHNAVYSYTLPIIINNKVVPYKIIISPSVAKISIDKDHLDFGIMDVGHNVTRRSFKIKNTGAKPTRFTIELGTNEFLIAVDPIKGVLQPYSDTAVNIEVGSLEEGLIEADILINCMVDTFHVSIKGTVVIGRLEVVNMSTCTSFTMVEFPRTYYGAKTTQRLVLRNNSAARTVFCCVYCKGDKDGEPFSHHPQFSINPLDGRLEPRESRIFTLEYEPHCKTSSETFHFETLVIKKLNYCKDMNVTDYPSGLYNTLRSIKSLEQKRRLSATSIKTPSSTAESCSQIIYTGYQPELLTDTPFDEFESAIQICLHGEPERVNVSCVPDTITLKHMLINQSVNRVVTLRNHSVHLPIRFAYEKVAFIDASPKFGSLQPLNSIDVKIIITACKFGRVNTKIRWLLYHQFHLHGADGALTKVGKVHVKVAMEAKIITTTPSCCINTGLAPTYIRECGKYFDNVQYNTKATIPKLIMDPLKRRERKDDKALIAFPNDRPRTLRLMLNKDKNFETIYAKLPRVSASSDDFYMKKEDQYLRSLTRDFYSKYLNQNRLDQLRTLHKNEQPEYELTALKQFLIFQHFVELNDILGTSVPRGILNGFIPLNPKQLYKIKIVPLHLFVGIMAPYSNMTNSFEIVNNNDTYVRIYIVPEKQRLTFPRGEAVNVHPHSTKKIEFTYYSEYEGFHNLIIRIVVNETHIFEMTMTAHVVPKKLYVNLQETVFGPNDPSFKFINFKNSLNVNIYYAWEMIQSNFVIEPIMAKIPPLKEMDCMITYDPFKNLNDNLNMHFATHSHSKHRYSVSGNSGVIKTVLCDEVLNFGYVGCNLRQFKYTYLWNFSNYTVQFSIDKSELMVGLKVYPISGTILKQSCQLLTLELQSLNCAQFNCTFMICMNGKPMHNLKIQGHVLFPNIKFSPAPIRLHKMPITSFQKYSVTMCNASKASTHISFDFQKQMDKPISETKKNGERFDLAEFILEPNQSKVLYIQMDPKNVTSMWYVIPFVFNYILGPPLGIVSIAAKTKNYISQSKYKLPDNIPILKVFTTVVESDFSLSRLEFQFVYHAYNASLNCCSGNTVFKNISEDKSLEFCIRLDEMLTVFEIEFESGKVVTPHPFSITFELQPGESTTLTIKYTPRKDSERHHFCTVPFYIRNDYVDDMHNYLRLNGTHELPEIIAPKTIYLEYLPLRFKFNKSIRVAANNHGENCQICAQSENPNLRVLINYMDRDLSSSRHELEVVIIYTSHYVEAFKSTIEFSCDCGSTAVIVCYGVAENSIFTSFRVVKNIEERIYFEEFVSRMSIQHSEALSHVLAKERISFPYYPEDTDEDYKFLTETVEALESWLYCQGFCGRYRFNIPETFAMLVPIPKTKRVGFRTIVEYVYVVPYVELLKLVASNQIADKFQSQIITTPTQNKTKQLYCLYQSILEFLKDLNGYFPHVEPELLLSYSDYKIFMTTTMMDSTKLLSKECHHSFYNFMLLSKQAWMDVILQTLKIFILGRIKVPKDTNLLLLLNVNGNKSKGYEYESAVKISFDATLPPKHSVSLRSVEFYNFVDSNWEACTKCTTLHHIYSNPEYFLLNWISYCFCISLESICDFELVTRIKAEKVVNDFDSCLTDSLLISTAIVTYCPYLKRYFSNLYWFPSGSAQFHHNAARVVQALSLIKSSFELRPSNLYNPINIQMVLFIAYLYEFLPSMYPHTTINVSAKLSKTSSLKISIENDNNFEISYTVLFFQNEHRCFVETRSTVLVKPKHTEILTIKYTAKYCRKVKVVLVLCGETLGNRCAKSIVYNLIGEPDITHIWKSYTFCTKLYTTQEHTMHIVAPYKGAASYDMFFCLAPPTSNETIEMIDYWDIIKEMVPCCFNYYTSQIMFNEEAEVTINITGVALSLRPREVWFFLRNAEQGDFLIHVEMVTLLTREVEILKAIGTSDVYKKPCLCDDKGKQFCKKYVLVNIPKTNTTLFEAFKNIFIRLKGGEEEFWTAYIRKTSSIRHMRLILADSHNLDIKFYMNLLVADKTYNIKLLGNGPGVSCPPTIDVTNLEIDYTKDAYVQMAIHVGDVPLTNLIMELWNEEHMELRRYKIIFDNFAN